jgi:phosphoglycerate dehydrogenase-like enzyme
VAAAPVRVVVLDDYQQVALDAGPWDRLGDRCAVETLTEHVEGTDALVAALAGAQVVVAMRERTAFDAERLARLPDLRLLVTTGMGNAAIDLEAAAARGIVVCGTGGRSRHTVELTWALILALVRSVPAEDARLRAGGWQHTVGTELDGKTLGLVGLGRIGSAMVPVARAFGMEVIAWSGNLEAAHATEVGAEAVPKDELFERADVVSIHYKLSARSEGIVGAAEIAAMKPTAYLVNTSRGPLVDTAALLRAVHDGAIAGAALDVYDREPLAPDDPLRSAPRTVLTPHLGYVTRENYGVFFADVVQDIEAWLDGRVERRLTPPPAIARG